MAFLGIGREENIQEVKENSNVDVVNDVVSEIRQGSTQEVTSVVNNEENINVEMNPKNEGYLDAREALTSVGESLTNAGEQLKRQAEAYRNTDRKISRRDFLYMCTKVVGGVTIGVGLAACGVKPDEYKEEDPLIDKIPTPEATKTPELERKVLLNNPIRLNTNDFSIGAEGYPSAIVDRSMFAKKENGEPLFIRYSGGQFNEVTYLHHTGERPPVVGEILPLMYKIPEGVGDMEVSLVQYAISAKSERAKINLNDGKNHYLVPIITSGNDSGVIESNGPNNSFEVKPDEVSGNTRGFISWVVLTEIGNELIVEGVTDGKSGIYIDPNNIPEEISSLMNGK